MFKLLGAIGAFLFFSLVMTWRDSYGAADCNKHKVYCHIVRISPRTPNAMELSNTISRLGKKFGVNPHLIVAIAMQESSLRNVNRVSGVIDASGCRLVVTDYGMLQVNVNSIKHYKLHGDLLSWNREYQLYAGVLILADKIKTFGHWSAYHSMTPKHNQKYRQLVGRYL